MYCPKCGYALPADSEFCQYCGEKLAVEVDGADAFTVAITEQASPAGEQQSSAESSQIFEEESVLPAHKEPASSNEDIVSNDHQIESAANNNGLTQLSDKASLRDKKKRFCKFCGGLIDENSKKCSSCGKQFFRFSARIVGMIALIIVFVALSGLNIYQYISNGTKMSDLEQRLVSRDASISDLEQELKTKESTIATQESIIVGLEEKAGYYDEICSFLSHGNIGYAADNFKSSDSIILVRKGETNRKFTLTAYWIGGGGVSTSFSNSLVARVSPDNDNWFQSTTMTIKPISEGINIVTFTNDVDSMTFKIMIIVTE